MDAQAAGTRIELSDYARGNQRFMSIAATGRVELINSLEDSPQGTEAPAISLQMKCNRPVRLLEGSQQKQGQQFQFRVWPVAHNGQRTWIQALANQPDLHCEIAGDGFRVTLFGEASLYPAVARLRQRTFNCPALVAQTGCEWDSSGPQATEILKDSYSALDARFFMLMGYHLTLAEFMTKDPNMALDFSRAPPLDLVMVDTLQILKDFVGVLTLRMLEWHAAHGARVYLMSSQALLLPREVAWLYAFKKNNPNIHFELYSSLDERETTKPQNTQMKDVLHSVHRNNHIKVFLTYSETQPQANAFIAGGRNISEMYFYENQPDNSRFPEITQWGEPPYGWIYFDDLDFKVTGTGMTAQFAKVLLEYNEKRALPQPAVPKSDEAFLAPGFIMASPFDESQGQLERSYVALIDRAQKSLELLSPYLNLTPAIEQAFVRARERGVDIHFVTNLNVLGDFMPGFMQPALIRGLRKEVGKFKISYYTRPGHIMHVKALLMDAQYLVLGSVNLNQRSFNHDTEVSVLFNETSVVQDFQRQIFESILPWISPLQRSDLPPRSLVEFLIGPFMGLM